MTTPSPFLPFEFDGEVLTLWQSITTPSIKTFAYQQRLRTLIAQSGQAWQADLGSLKVLDVLLSAVKSDLANRHISEEQALSHDEFVKMLVVFAFHSVQVLERELVKVLPSGKIKLYSAQGFNRLYARTFAGAQSPPTEPDAFYQGLVAVITDNANAVQSSFVLALMGSRLFGSPKRSVVGLDEWGKPNHKPSEDSLYWALRDLVQSVPQADGFFVPLKSDDTPPVVPNLPPAQTVDIFSQLEEAYLSEPVPPKAQPAKSDFVHNPSGQLSKNSPAHLPHNPPTNSPTNPSQSRPQNPPLDLPKNLADPSSVQPAKATQPSMYKQKARASHTPKLFAEAYQDLLTMPLPADSHQLYQQAMSVLTQFDKFIDGELAKGKTLDDIGFSPAQKDARKKALEQLVVLVKHHHHSSAMLRLALYCFEGRGITQNTAKALMLAEQSANMGDVRAQKLLSRLYYQGFDAQNGGIKPSQEQGDIWLKRSADGGHSEAKKLLAYMNQVQVLKEDYRVQQQLDKRYGMFFVALIVGAIFLVLLMNMIW